MTKQEELRSLRVSVRNTYIESTKDGELADYLEEFVENKKDFEAGAGSPRRGLFVVGASGTGKSTSIKRALARNPDLQQYRNEYGELVHQYITVKLRKASNCRSLVEQVLTAMNLPCDGSEAEMTDEMMNQLKARGVWLVHLDELQHTVRSNTTKAFEAIQDLLKEMMDREDHPLHMILSGVPRIRHIREEKQIARRSEVLPFHTLESPADNIWIKKLLADIVLDGCGMTLAPDLKTPEFYERLCLATAGAWGTMIETIQNVAFSALRRGKTELTTKHFGRVYETTSGCTLDQNIFMAANFRDIDPSNFLNALEG
jgi:hypothetical protein